MNEIHGLLRKFGYQNDAAGGAATIWRHPGGHRVVTGTVGLPKDKFGWKAKGKSGATHRSDDPASLRGVLQGIHSKSFREETLNEMGMPRGGFKEGDRVHHPVKGHGTVTYTGSAPGMRGRKMVSVDWDNPVQKILGPEPLYKGLRDLKRVNEAARAIAAPTSPPLDVSKAGLKFKVNMDSSKVTKSLGSLKKTVKVGQKTESVLDEGFTTLHSHESSGMSLEHNYLAKDKSEFYLGRKDKLHFLGNDRAEARKKYDFALELHSKKLVEREEKTESRAEDLISVVLSEGANQVQAKGLLLGAMAVKKPVVPPKKKNC